VEDRVEEVSVAQAQDAVEEAQERVGVARREFMKLFGFGGAALLAGAATRAEAGELPHDRRGQSPYASAWKFAPGLLYMNIGTTGASPQKVVRDMAADYQDLAQSPTAYFFGQQGWRNAIAPSFGCDPYELVMSFNTTDGLFRILLGLEWKAGDELITTNMEESAGISAYSILADRYGVVVKPVLVPTGDAYSDQEVFRRFEAQLTSRTKAVLFSSPLYLTGTRLQERDLCLWAARKGLISIVDGAHQPGMLAMNLHEMGCDFLSAAGHKWQCGPGQTGFMYIRNGYTPSPYVRQAPTSDFGFLVPGGETVAIPVPGYANTNPLPTYYPTNTLLYGQENGTSILLKGRRSPDDNVAAVLQLVGNGSRPTQKALYDCCALWDRWGRKEIEQYIVSLAQYLRAKIASVWGPRSLSFPFAPGGNHVGHIGLTSFNPFSPGFDYNADLTPAMASAQKSAAAEALSTLQSAFDIVLRTTTVPHSLRSDPRRSAAADAQSTPLRVSTHLFHSRADVDRVVDALLGVVPPPGTTAWDPARPRRGRRAGPAFARSDAARRGRLSPRRGTRGTAPVSATGVHDPRPRPRSART
jgi:selenocysteine lyase/cysteine desulfurase